jgi:predicted type IV restriction endonuclease
VVSGNFPDYVLHASDRRVVAVEAKKLGHPLGARDAGQLVQYCSTLGVRWGVLTDGRYWKVYDAPLLGIEPEERIVIDLDLADYTDREEFEARLYPELALLSKEEMGRGHALERRAAQESVRDLLATPSSATLRALRQELEDKKRTRFSPQELADLVSELLG